VPGFRRFGEQQDGIAHAPRLRSRRYTGTA
jgi:hypothetical protein